MNHAEQVEAVGLILNTEKEKTRRTLELMRIANETGPSEASKPAHQTVERTYPEIKPTTKFLSARLIIPCLVLTALSCVFFTLIDQDMVGALVDVAIMVYIPLYYFKMYKPAKAQEIEDIRNSAEYKGQCAQLDAQYDAQQASYDDEYARAMEKYENEQVPAYKKAFSEWQEDRARRKQETSAALADASGKLEDLYETTKLIPTQFRSIAALEHIYGTIASSDQYDVKDAIGSYEKELQLRATHEQSKLIDAQNDLQAEQNHLQAEQTKAINRQTAAQVAASIDAHSQRKKISKTLSSFK